MKRVVTFGMAFVCGLALSSCRGRAAGSDEVITESRPRLIPAGPGLKAFDATRHTIPPSEIQYNIPRNTIPALSRPHMIPAGLAGATLQDSDRVLGVFLNGEARAYPIRILNWHELVNDEVGGVPVLVSWCPLCGSAVVYDPMVDGRRLTFGVSGLLYKRNVLMFDHETDSLWSQLLSRAVTGPLAGRELKVLPATNTTWGEWEKRHPATRVISFLTGHARDYRRDPYADYPLVRKPAMLVRVGQTVKILPYSELAKAPGPVTVDFGDSNVVVDFDRDSETPRVETGGAAEPVILFGFLDDLKAFYPRSEIWKYRH